MDQRKIVLAGVVTQPVVQFHAHRQIQPRQAQDVRRVQRLLGIKTHGAVVFQDKQINHLRIREGFVDNHQVPLKFLLGTVQQFLPLAKKTVSHRRKALLVLPVVLQPAAERTFTDVLGKTTVFLAGLAVEQALHLLVKRLIVATRLGQRLAGTNPRRLSGLILAGEESAELFDGHGVKSPLVNRTCRRLRVNLQGLGL